MNAPPDSSDYADLFLRDTPLLDTRAPLEFARGAFPTATNLPLMSDEERAAVGSCYKQKGPEAAIALGHELVAGEMREARIDAWQDFAEAHPTGFLYCFRGGLRSQIVQQWLAERGIVYPRVAGGYKSMRRFLIDTLEACSVRAPLLIVAGATGTGKTLLLRDLKRSIDLEGLAHHRGSAFGRLLDPQPTQIDFENAIAIALHRLVQQPGPVILEDEGHLIGRLALPATLRERMSQAPLLVLEYPLEERIDVVIDDYIVDLGRRFAARFGDDGAARHRARLVEDLGRTRKRLGGARHVEVAALMEAAFDEQERSGSPDAHRAWIRRLLKDYYDPMYAFQLSRREGRRLCVGRREDIAAYTHEFLVDA